MTTSSSFAIYQYRCVDCDSARLQTLHNTSYPRRRSSPQLLMILLQHLSVKQMTSYTAVFSAIILRCYNAQTLLRPMIYHPHRLINRTSLTVTMGIVKNPKLAIVWLYIGPLTILSTWVQSKLSLMMVCTTFLMTTGMSKRSICMMRRGIFALLHVTCQSCFLLTCQSFFPTCLNTLTISTSYAFKHRDSLLMLWPARTKPKNYNSKRTWNLF